MGQGLDTGAGPEAVCTQMAQNYRVFGPTSCCPLALPLLSGASPMFFLYYVGS